MPAHHPSILFGACKICLGSLTAKTLIGFMQEIQFNCICEYFLLESIEFLAYINVLMKF